MGKNSFKSRLNFAFAKLSTYKNLLTFTVNSRSQDNRYRETVEVRRTDTEKQKKLGGCIYRETVEVKRTDTEKQQKLGEQIQRNSRS